MPSVNDQWNAVFATPLPFVLAVIAVATMVWGAMLWRYKGANEKLAELYDLLNKKAELQNEAAARVRNELEETIASLRMQIEQAQIVDKQQKDQLVQLMDAMSRTYLKIARRSRSAINVG
jgi:hypothetical protein